MESSESFPPPPEREVDMRAAPGTSSTHSSASAMQQLIHSNAAAANGQFESESLLQIAQNLRYQHGWTEVRVHKVSTTTGALLPRPLLSGVPPQRLYVSPDEQIDLLQQQKLGGQSSMLDVYPQREWVLPSQLREKWSLRMFGRVFDAITTDPIETLGSSLFPGEESEDYRQPSKAVDEDAEPTRSRKWRISSPKRLLLATVDTDSTVVYYIVHDGIVKPRQN